MWKYQIVFLLSSLEVLLLSKFGSERGISIDAAVVFVKKTSLLFRLALAILTLTSLALLKKIQKWFSSNSHFLDDNTVPTMDEMMSQMPSDFLSNELESEDTQNNQMDGNHLNPADFGHVYVLLSAFYPNFIGISWIKWFSWKYRSK